LQEAEVHDEIENVIKNIHTNCDFLRTVDRQTIVGNAFNMLVAGVACLKHEGFLEEREWRAIYAPIRSPSALMERSTEIVGGIPQIIYKIPLDRAVSDTLADLDLLQIFDRLIIGPSDYPWPMKEAFSDALTKMGVSNAFEKIFNSDIPIRAY
jgi:hypothetical protein